MNWGAEDLFWVPPMMGLEDEIVLLRYADDPDDGANDGFTSHYTALLNGRRVFVFYVDSDSKWFIGHTSPNVSNHREFRAEYKDHNSYFSGTPLELLLHLQAITSGGNDEQP